MTFHAFVPKALPCLSPYGHYKMRKRNKMRKRKTLANHKMRKRNKMKMNKTLAHCQFFIAYCLAFQLLPSHC
jgi:hypothetical protein